METTRPNWDEFYLNMADVIASRSKDTSTKIGAVIVKDNAVISMGYNGFPRGVDDSIKSRYERPIKYSYTEHGERNAIFNAARHGTSTMGATMYTQGTPCADCARACIQAGIVRVVASRDLDGRWAESCTIGREMMTEAGVKWEVLSE